MSAAATKPFSRFELMAAQRYLRPRRKEAFISVISIISLLGIMLGVATLIVVMAVMNGFRGELIDNILGVNGHLVLNPIDSPLTDYAEVSDRVSAVPGVVAAIPFIEGQALGSGTAGGGSGILVRGIRGKDISKVPGVSNTIGENGSLDDFQTAGGVAIGQGLARKLGLFVGDRLTIVSPQGAITPMGTVPRIKAYPVVAIFQSGMALYDSTFVFMPFGESQAYFNYGDEAVGIEIFIDEPDQVADMQPIIEEAAARPIYSVSWRDRDAVFFGLLALERNVMFIIVTLIVLVAAMNIVSGLIMLVKEKGRDIAILRTMGATRGAVMRIFFMAGALIGTVGTLGGLVLGTLVCLKIDILEKLATWMTGQNPFENGAYFINQLPARMDPFETMTIVLVSLALCYLATIPPSWRAARMDPVEALRYE
jgi:lipoprotein-releasing system permease protein